MGGEMMHDPDQLRKDLVHYQEVVNEIQERIRRLEEDLEDATAMSSDSVADPKPIDEILMVMWVMVIRLISEFSDEKKKEEELRKVLARVISWARGDEEGSGLSYLVFGLD